MRHLVKPPPAMVLVQKLYKYLSFLPLFCLAGSYVYVASVEGWGAYGVATILLFPITLSALMMIFGVVLCVLLYCKGLPFTRVLISLLVSSLPLLMLLLRWLQLEVAN